MFRTILKSMTALVVISLVSTAFAQQPAGVAAPPSPQPPPAATETAAASASPDGAARALKSTMPGMRELSPWSMFMSADIVVKGVIVGLVFASLATWTIAIAKLIELAALRRRLRQALRK